MKTPNFAPIATLVYNQLIYVQVFPAMPNDLGVEMVELRIQNAAGVDFTNNMDQKIWKSRFIAVKTLAKGYDASFVIDLGNQQIVRGTRFTHELTYAQRFSYDEQLATAKALQA